MRVPTKELRGAHITAVQEASFWSLVKLDLTGCWMFVGSESGEGRYGRFKIGGIRYSANRVAYAIAYGFVGAEDFVLHECDTPGCVRPDHLRRGTPAENAEDRVSRGRQAIGSRVGGALLNEEKVKMILMDTRPARTIGKDFGVGKSTIQKIKQRVNWRHVQL